MSEDTRNHLGHGNMTKFITFFVIGIFVLGPRECWGLGDANDTKWWETALFYDVSWPFNEHSHFYENLRALIEDIDNMKKLRVDALCLQPIFSWKRKPYSISSYAVVNESLGTIDDIVELIEMAHKNGIKVILGIVPFYTSDQHVWFRRWAQNDGPDNGLYLSMSGPKLQEIPLRRKKRKITYRGIWGQPYSPILNLDMESVRRQLIEEMFTFWLSKGVDGFHILECRVYVESATDDEQPKREESTKKYLNEIREHVDKWTTKDNSTSKYLAVDLTRFWFDWSLYNTMKDLPGIVALNNVELPIYNAEYSYDKIARVLKQFFLDQFNAKPPGASIRWMLTNNMDPPSGVGARNDAALTMLMMLLPGQARVLMVNEKNVEKTPFSNTNVTLSSRSHCYACPFANITALMKLPVFQQGEYDLKTLNDDNVLVLRRHMSDDPNVYTAVINLADREEKISPTELFPDLGERLEILFNTDTNPTTIGSAPYQDSVSVTAHSGMVLMSARTKRETNKDAERPKKEGEERTEKTKISGEKEPSGGGEGGTTVPTVGKGERAMPSQHGQSGTTERNKDVGTPKKEGEGRTEKPKISGEKDQGKGDVEDKSVGKGGEKPSRSGEDAAAKGKEDEKVHERVEDDPKGKRKEINNDEGHVGHEKTTGVLKGVGKFWRSIGQLCTGHWRKKLETASRPKTYRWNRQ